VETSSSELKAQAEIKALKAELDKEKKRIKSPTESAASEFCKRRVVNVFLLGPFTESATAPRPLKGASLANPNKKARKYQAIEFESDEE
jgi:hypothetical protein